MASLQDARSLAEQLHGLSGRLQSELDRSSVDFEKLVELSDEIGASADQLASTFSAINGSLTGLLGGAGEEERSTTPSDGAGDEADAGGEGRGKARPGGQRRRGGQRRGKDADA